MTDRFGSIMVVTSPDIFEPGVLRAAFELADTHGARLTLLDVVEPPSRWALVRRRRTGAALASDRLELLRSVVADLRDGATAHIEVVVGQLHVEVIARALEHRHDLVIVGSGAPATSDLHVVPKHVTQLLRKCPVPVWVMRTAQSRGTPVLALIDPKADDPVRDELNVRVLELAASLARDRDGELHVGHALERDADHASELAPEMLRRRADAGSEVTVHLVSGHAGEALPALAADIDAGVVVMGTVARTGISGLVIGNSAETMLSSTPCSVLAVKPGDPVTTVAPATDTVAEGTSTPGSSDRRALT